MCYIINKIMSDTSDEDNILTPDELKNTVKEAELSLLPQKSREKYLKAYDLFNKWRQQKSANSFSETVLLSYFIELAQTRQPSTMWSIYSMLKTTIKTKNNVHIDSYPKLMAYLKITSVGHKPKKSKIFTASNIETFLNEAPDCDFLAAKVILIIGINGACRTTELLNLRVHDIEKHSNQLLLINLPNTKTNIDRSFVIREEYVHVVEKYKTLRPENTKTDRFFLQYRNEKCFRQPMGVNKIGGTPRDIATYLKLKEPELYTGHSFRRTSATLLADSGADLTTLKRHGGWRSNTVAEGYIEDSIQNKSKISKRIVKTIHLNQPADTWTRPSTSRDMSIDPSTSSNMNIGPSTSRDMNIGPSTSSDMNIGPSTSSDMNIGPSTSSDMNIGPTTFRYMNIENRPDSPTYTVLPSQSQSLRNETQTSSTTRTQVASTTITGPNKTVTLNLQNCNNCTFNF